MLVIFLILINRPSIEGIPDDAEWISCFDWEIVNGEWKSVIPNDDLSCWTNYATTNNLTLKQSFTARKFWIIGKISTRHDEAELLWNSQKYLINEYSNVEQDWIIVFESNEFPLMLTNIIINVQQHRSIQFRGIAYLRHESLSPSIEGIPDNAEYIPCNDWEIVSGNWFDKDDDPSNVNNPYHRCFVSGSSEGVKKITFYGSKFWIIVTNSNSFYQGDLLWNSEHYLFPEKMLPNNKPFEKDK